ncbi:DNA polymerase III, delta prime subunit [Pelagirhabdus alkalitolerans]|uniref:DNA polymerase III, delta prime subunit n=1 Tax=Pelagirhabdus alkalitolerans TaxID=1612202 RepID=A0A1G6MKW2_9BACI|nr:DNA polymerase III subunit delta' [Pelagirhabdus alkalitolerans]SDC56183.1 DNA polymerase III, delta prime subunit [Pelagirhabdus alkalitolerans]
MVNWQQISETQPVASKMLTQMIKQDRVAHAYLIQGDAGTNSREIAKLLTKSIVCRYTRDANPCQACADCHRIDSGNHPNMHWIEPDGLSIKTEQVATLKKEFTYAGVESNEKVYVISEADRMTTNAANRLLKFLEEPGEKTTAILLTENSYGILDTILSRTQVISLRPLSHMEIERVLIEEGMTADNARLFSIVTNDLTKARELDQDEWFAQARKLVVQLMSILRANQDEALLFIEKNWLDHFKDRDQLDRGLDLLLLWFKDIIYLHVENEDALVFKANQEDVNACLWHYSRQDATHILAQIMNAKRELLQNVHPTLVMEELTLQMQR